MTFSRRISALRRELGLSVGELNNKIMDIIEENRLDMQLKTPPPAWQKGCAPSQKTYYPPAGALACIAAALDTSVDYLLARHNIRDIKNDSVKLSFRCEECNEEYKKHHCDKTMFADGIIYSQWANNIMSGKTDYHKIKIGPFIKIADATGLTLDYILGLSGEKFWQTYCLNNALYEYLPKDTLLLTEDGALWLLDTNNRTVSRSTGETKDISDILSLKPKIVRSFETF